MKQPISPQEQVAQAALVAFDKIVQVRTLEAERCANEAKKQNAKLLAAGRSPAWAETWQVLAWQDPKNPRAYHIGVHSEAPVNKYSHGISTARERLEASYKPRTVPTSDG